MQPHLHVVAVLLPAGHLAANEGARLVHVHLIPLRGPSARAQSCQKAWHWCACAAPRSETRGHALRARAAKVSQARTGARAPRRSQTPENWRALLARVAQECAGARRASCGDRPCMSCSQLGECALQRKGGARRARGRWAGARLVQQLHRRRQPGQAAAHDGHLQARRPLRAPKAPGRACSGKTSPIESQEFQCASEQMVSARRRGAALSSDR